LRHESRIEPTARHTLLLGKSAEPTMIRLALFALATVLLAWVSRRQLTRPDAHGFYRFGVWELMLVHWVLLKPYAIQWWWQLPLSGLEVCAWLLLTVALALVFWPAYLLLKQSRAHDGREDELLFPFEKTTELITDGLYRYVRHPMYASLLCATWGMLILKFSLPGLAVAAAATLGTVLASRAEEAENLRYFGEAYADYMSTSKRFIPWIA
jgi:protein-S-isoprenylcysteine O-methyltransferase Ste14